MIQESCRFGRERNIVDVDRGLGMCVVLEGLGGIGADFWWRYLWKQGRS